MANNCQRIKGLIFTPGKITVQIGSPNTKTFSKKCFHYKPEEIDKAVAAALAYREAALKKLKRVNDGVTMTSEKHIYKYFNSYGMEIGYRVSLTCQGHKVTKAFNFDKCGGSMQAMQLAIMFRNAYITAI